MRFLVLLLPWILACALMGCTAAERAPEDFYHSLSPSPEGEDRLIEAVLAHYPCSFHDAELAADWRLWSNPDFAGKELGVLLVSVTRLGAIELDGVVCPVIRVFRVILGMLSPRGNTCLMILKGKEPIYWSPAWFSDEIRVYPPASLEFEGLNYRFNLADPEDLKLLKTEGPIGVYELLEGSPK
jgi:hypothetical protein